MTLASRRQNVKWTKGVEGTNNPNFNGGKYIDDKGYIRVLRPDHPFNNKGYIYEHRLVMEAYLERYLQTWESVHHINEIKLDNRIENFFLTTVSEHSSIHREGKKKTDAVRKKLRKGAKERAKSSDRGAGGKFAKADTAPSGVLH